MAHLAVWVPRTSLRIQPAFHASMDTPSFRRTLRKKRQVLRTSGICTPIHVIPFCRPPWWVLVDGLTTWVLAEERHWTEVPVIFDPAPPAGTYLPHVQRAFWHPSTLPTVTACTYCQTPIFWRRPAGMPRPVYQLHRATFDHVIPRSLGGSDRSENLAGACHRCNITKDAHMHWRAPQAWCQDAERAWLRLSTHGWIPQDALPPHLPLSRTASS